MTTGSGTSTPPVTEAAGPNGTIARRIDHDAQTQVAVALPGTFGMVTDLIVP